MECVCIQEYFRLVLCGVCPLPECPLSEVSLYACSSHLRSKVAGIIIAKSP